MKIDKDELLRLYNLELDELLSISSKYISDDVEFYGDLGTSYAYFVNPAVVEELNETAFRYAWFNEILDVTIYVGKDGYINHIQGFSDEDPMITNNYVDIKITNIGTTTLPDGVPSKPTEETKLDKIDINRELGNICENTGLEDYDMETMFVDLPELYDFINKWNAKQDCTYFVGQTIRVIPSKETLDEYCEE